MATTKDTFLSVLDQFGFKHVKETRFGETFDGPELKKREGQFIRAKIKEEGGKTRICLYGMGRPSYFTTGDLKLSEMQLSSLLTILVTNHL